MNRILKLKWVLLVILMSIAIMSCTSDNEEELFPVIIDPNETEISFATEIAPIIENNCAVTGCHVAGVQSPNFGEKSNILDRATRIKTRTLARSMPPGSRTITDEQVSNISTWVDQGAKDN